MQLYFSVIGDIIIRILDPHWAPFGPGAQEASSNADPDLNPLFLKNYIDNIFSLILLTVFIHLSGLYVIDSIVRQSRHQFGTEKVC